MATRAPGSRLVALPALVLALGATAAAAPAARGQTFDDGLLVPRRQLRLTAEYGRERWDEYWEGTLRRSNENIGTLTTRSVTWSAAYGLTSRVSLLAMLPRVRTSASQGVLSEQEGWQDASVAAKLRLLQARVTPRATLGVVALAGASLPASDYTPDFQPLSIGFGARRATARGALHLRDRSGLFAEAAAGYTWRSTVHLDRPAYYDGARLVLSDEVAMPDVADYAAGLGYQGGGLCLPVMLVRHRTLGGHDIRRQDMPFVSNRMDFTRLQAMAMYTIPRLSSVTLNAGVARTLAGRNVGRATMVSAGLTTAVRL